MVKKKTKTYTCWANMQTTIKAKIKGLPECQSKDQPLQMLSAVTYSSHNKTKSSFSGAYSRKTTLCQTVRKKTYHCLVL